MRRALLFCVGIVLGLAAEIILWNGPALYAITDGWHAAAFTRFVGLAVIVEGTLCALGAALCLGRAIGQLDPSATELDPTATGGGPVLPICGILFLLAAIGPFGQALHNSHTLDVMDSMPGEWGTEIVDEFRKRERTEWTIGVLWLVVGGTALCSPWLLEPRVWRLSWPISGTGCGITVAGFLLSGMGAFVCFASGLTGEGASKELFFSGYLGILAGAIVAVAGSILAVFWKSKSYIGLS